MSVAKLSLRAQITIGFTILIISMLVLNIFSLTSLKSVRDNAQELGQTWLEGSVKMGQLEAELNQLRSLSFQHLLSNSAEEKKNLDKRLESSLAHLDELVAFAQQRIVTA
jgi:CHASE3 domain sensor protein